MCEFIEGETVAIGASGGKDSTVLAHVLYELNKRHQLHLNLVLVAIDEGIDGYRDLSLERVKETAATLSLPLLISSYEELFSGWSMDKVVLAAGGPRNACSFCGIFRHISKTYMGCQFLGLDRNRQTMDANMVFGES